MLKLFALIFIALWPISVGATTINDTEPNDSAAQAQAFEAGDMIVGNLNGGGIVVAD